MALDQRGHGDSEHTPNHSRKEYESDVLALYTQLGIREAVLLGNSFGGSVAYWLAARRPADYWSDWLASTCPVLVIRGAESKVARLESQACT